MFEKLKKNYFLIIVLVLLMIGRGSIANQGFLDDSDEVDYYASEIAFDAFKKGDLTAVSATLPLTEGKPTETFIKMLLVPLHRAYSGIIQKPVYTQNALQFFGFYNMLIHLLLLTTVYLIFIKLGHCSDIAALSILALGIFINYNIYVRHLLSYDLGLLFFLCSLLSFIDAQNKNKINYRWVGFWAGLGFTTYHGYFMMLFILAILMAWQQNFQRKNTLRSYFSFAQTFLSIIVGYELFYALSGNSFIADALKISGSINQGSFSEGFTFLFKYFYQVEGFFGVFILSFGFFAALKISLIRLEKTLSQKIVLLAFAAWLLYVFAVLFLMKLVFYGRIIHFFYPFIMLSILEILKPYLPIEKSKIWGIAVLLCVQYYFNLKSLNSFTYPRKVLNDWGLFDKYAQNVNMNFLTELNFPENYIHDPRNILLGMIPNRLPPGDYDIINTCFFDHHPDRFIQAYRPYEIDSNEIIFSKLHFMSYPAYTFEYCSKTGRAFYLDKKFKISIVRKK